MRGPHTILAENAAGAIVGDSDGNIREVDAIEYAAIEEDSRFYVPLREAQGGLIQFKGNRTGLQVSAVLDMSDNTWYVLC